MIGLVDYDLYTSKNASAFIPNLEIMKLATYYKFEENKFCRLVSLDEQDLSNYEKIYFFSESHYFPQIPEQFLRAEQVVYGGTAFTKGIYIPFKNSIIDYTIPKPFIYKDFLKEKYEKGIKTKVIEKILDNAYYRCYAGDNKLPIPPVMTRKQIIMYDREFFYQDWKEIITKLTNRLPSTILRIHPIVCHTLSDFFQVRENLKIGHKNNIILDLDIPLDEVYCMTRRYKKRLLAEIVPNSKIYIKIGDTFSTNSQYFKDFIYKLNLVYCLWSEKIPIKIWYEPFFIGYRNPLENISKRIMSWSNTQIIGNGARTINETIVTKKTNVCMEERQLLLKFFPSAKDLFDQTYEQISKRGRWRI